MYKITKEFQFCASHCLDKLPKGHPCANVHGHNYTVVVELAGEQLNDVGMLLDYREMSDIKKHIDATFDHKHLNDVVPFHSSSENLAAFFARSLQTYIPIHAMHRGVYISAITIKETDKTSARYEVTR